MSIPFTQFLMPDGRQRPVEIGRPPEVEAAARRLFDLGCRFEIEMLQTGEVSMEVMLGEDSLAGEICPNGPPVPPAVDRMIKQAEFNLSNPQTTP